MPRKILNRLLALNNRALSLAMPRVAQRNSIRLYRALGVKFSGAPNYISCRTTLDSTDYSLIEIGEGVTISSYIRLLTHDWSLYTVSKAIGYRPQRPVGRIAGISIGDYSFIGTGSVIMPSTRIGKGCLIGAGTVVRGEIPDFSIVIGSPGQIVGDTRDYVQRNVARGILPDLPEAAATLNPNPEIRSRVA